MSDGTGESVAWNEKFIAATHNNGFVWHLLQAEVS